MTVEIEAPDDPPEEKTIAFLTSKLDPLAAQSTLTIDVRKLDTGDSALPFQPAPPGAGLASLPDREEPKTLRRADPFSTTMTLSAAEHALASVEAQLPFTQPEPKPIFEPQYILPGQYVDPEAPPPAAPTALETPVGAVLGAALRNLSPEPKTIGEVAVAGGALAASSDAARESVQAAHATKQASNEAIVLLYLHRPSMQRISRKAAWQSILDALDESPVDPEADDPALSIDPSEIQEQSQVYAILKRGRYSRRESALAALEEAADKPGRFAPPLELFEGELEPALDDLERLRALAAIMPAFAKGDEKLQEAIAAAAAFSESAGAAYAPPLVRRHEAEIRQAYGSGKRSMMKDEIDALVVRALLEKRHYQKQRVFGGEFIRAELSSLGSPPLVVYIPHEAALLLPLSARFRARILAEIHFAQDEQEPSALALRGLAVANVVRRGRA